MLTLIFFSFFAFNLYADDERAHINYKLHCQGCHLPEGAGVLGAVPRLKNFVGYYLHSLEGRDFIAQVPGVSMSSLKDDELTELLNWLVLTYSSDQLPDQFEPYTATEIAILRRSPNKDPLGERNAILNVVAEQLPALAAEIEADGYAY